VLNNASAGRFPDGNDSDSNCTDFRVQPATTLLSPTASGATNVKVGSVMDFAVGQTVMVDTDANKENAVIATVGSAGATTATTATAAGDAVIPVMNVSGFVAGQTAIIDRETVTVLGVAGGGATARINLSKPLASAHAAGVQVSGTGITFADGLTKAHAGGTQILTNIPTPGAPNRY
jgi:hypothetical protein